MGQFVKGLSYKFLDALGELAGKEGWWRDVLADKQLIIGIRNEKLDVYWHGQSIFNVGFGRDGVKVSTHIKYLLEPALTERVSMRDDATFAVNPKTIPILSRYEGAGTLEKLKKAADAFSGQEKKGVHAVVLANENVIEVEIRLDAKDLDTQRDGPRIDIAALQQRPEGIEIVFWEAKLFANKELRASSPSEPKVVKQIKEYRTAIEERRSDIISSYATVAKNLVEIANNSGGARKIGPAIKAVADGAELRISSPPHVGVVIFGFDADQKVEGGIGHKHFMKLEEQLGARFLRTRGEADGLKL